MFRSPLDRTKLKRFEDQLKAFPLSCCFVDMENKDKKSTEEILKRKQDMSPSYFLDRKSKRREENAI